jgi:hypothetical protein
MRQIFRNAGGAADVAHIATAGGRMARGEMAAQRQQQAHVVCRQQVAMNGASGFGCRGRGPVRSDVAGHRSWINRPGQEIQ